MMMIHGDDDEGDSWPQTGGTSIIFVTEIMFCGEKA